MHDWMMRNLTPLVPADVPANLPGDMAIAEGTHQFMSRRYYNDETGRGWTEWAPYIPPKGLAKTLSAAPVVPLTDERLQKHAMRAGDCPPGSMVVLLSSLRRMLSAAPVVREPQSREQQIAIREAHCNTASDEYFGARPQVDDATKRRIYEAGFKEGWESGIGGGGK